MLGVVGDLWQFATEVADRTIDGLNRKLAELAGADNATLAVELGALDLEGGNLAVNADDLDQVKTVVDLFKALELEALMTGEEV